MSSYQAIESRLRSVEDKLTFAMTAMRMKAALSTGLVGADGREQLRAFEGTLLDLYNMSRQVTTVAEAPGGPQV